MAEELVISVDDLLGALTARDRQALASGAASEEVWYQFVTMEDDRVRPSHAALHGTVWRSGDPSAPVPPLDYGCRCILRPVSPIGRKIPGLPKAPSKPLPTGKVYSDFLSDQLGASVLARAREINAKATAANAQAATVLELQRLRPDLTASQARDIWRMIRIIEAERGRP